MEQALQNQWSHTTLKVARNIAKANGRRYYSNDTLLQDDLESFLILEAQRVATQYTPDTTQQDPETRWAKYLSVTLSDRARYHWSNWINAKTDRPEYQTAKEANQPWARIEHLINQDDRTMSIQAGMTGITGNKPLTPEAHLNRLETLEEILQNLDKETLPELTQCIEESCTAPRRGQQTRCENHYRSHLNIWAEGKTCSIEGCPDRAGTRGLCKKHYQAFWSKHSQEGTLIKKPVTTHCTVEGCTKPHEAHGLCKTHYGKYRQTLKPPCTVAECTSHQISRGRCNKHYKELRAKEKANGQTLS